MPNYKPPAHARPLNLLSPFLKVKRAKGHVRDINRQRVAFGAVNTHFGIPKYDVKTNLTEFFLGETPEINPDIALLLGDFAHNLRTALDHLACELARSVGISDPMVYFPICESESLYNTKSSQKTKGIPKEAKDFIDAFIGPYGGHDDLLWGLHELDRIDKHRLLIATTPKTQAWSIKLGRSKTYKFVYIPELKAGDKIGEIEGNHELDKGMSVTAEIAFREPQVFKGDALFPTLPNLAEHVERIIGMFGPNPL